MNKKSEFKVGPNLELMAIEAKTVLPQISARVRYRIQREKRINALTKYFSKSPKSEECDYLNRVF